MNIIIKNQDKRICTIVSSWLSFSNNWLALYVHEPQIHNPLLMINTLTRWAKLGVPLSLTAESSIGLTSKLLSPFPRFSPGWRPINLTVLLLSLGTLLSLSCCLRGTSLSAPRPKLYVRRTRARPQPLTIGYPE